MRFFWPVENKQRIETLISTNSKYVQILGILFISKHKPYTSSYQGSLDNVHIRPLSSVQNKLRFILHELYNLS